MILIVVLTSSIFFAPVQFAFPLRNNKVAVFGLLKRYTSPGNCSGSYSASSNDCAITSKSNLSENDVDATIFSTITSGILFPPILYQMTPIFLTFSLKQRSRLQRF